MRKHYSKKNHNLQRPDSMVVFDFLPLNCNTDGM